MIQILPAVAVVLGAALHLRWQERRRDAIRLRVPPPEYPIRWQQGPGAGRADRRERRLLRLMDAATGISALGVAIVMGRRLDPSPTLLAPNLAIIAAFGFVGVVAGGGELGRRRGPDLWFGASTAGLFLLGRHFSWSDFGGWERTPEGLIGLRHRGLRDHAVITLDPPNGATAHALYALVASTACGDLDPGAVRFRSYLGHAALRTVLPFAAIWIAAIALPAYVGAFAVVVGIVSTSSAQHGLVARMVPPSSEIPLRAALRHVL